MYNYAISEPEFIPVFQFFDSLKSVLVLLLFLLLEPFSLSNRKEKQPEGKHRFTELQTQYSNTIPQSFSQACQMHIKAAEIQFQILSESSLNQDELILYRDDMMYCSSIG